MSYPPCAWTPPFPARERGCRRLVRVPGVEGVATAGPLIIDKRLKHQPNPIPLAPCGGVETIASGACPNRSDRLQLARQWKRSVALTAKKYQAHETSNRHL